MRDPFLELKTKRAGRMRDPL